MRQRDSSHEWKCQPGKFLTTELERYEILLGSFSLFVVSVLTGFISWYAANDGKYLTIYYRADEYGWIWFFLQIPIVFIYQACVLFDSTWKISSKYVQLLFNLFLWIFLLQDYLSYLIHRLYHYPFLYKHFHKLHHKFKQPTAFSVTAIHPLEMVTMQMALASPIILMPVHWSNCLYRYNCLSLGITHRTFSIAVLFYGILIYTYYHGIIDHSGIAFKAAFWQPWQPDAIFHDNHHQYFHVNYGFNMFIWDKVNNLNEFLCD